MKSHHFSSRSPWMLRLAGIIALGMASRMVHTGFVIFDKYLGDALYAAMIYAILRIVWIKAAVTIPAMILMTVIELFQLTMIPAQLMTSDHAIVRICARLLGTQFSFFDLVAYAFGIACMFLIAPRDR